jgi:hypothetical protein
MKASISKNTVNIIGKLSEAAKITKIYETMMSEFNSMCLVEILGFEGGDYDLAEVTLCYSVDDATVATIKESYSSAKKAA